MFTSFRPIRKPLRHESHFYYSRRWRGWLIEINSGRSQLIPQQLGARLKSAHSVAIVFGIIFACLAASVSSAAIAQQTEDVLQLDPGPPAENTRPIDTDMVVVDGEELFLVRGSSALPANERAGSIIDRIITAAEASDQATVQVEIRPGEFGPTIYADEKMIMVTTVADAEFEQVCHLRWHRVARSGHG
jgi:hypothetical protein